MITIRRLNKRTVAVLKDSGSKEIKRFKGKHADARAKAYAIKRNHGNLGIDWDKVLLITDGPVLCHITNAGDNTEPPKLCKYSILRIAGAEGEATILACELTDMARQWLKIARRFKKSKKS